ncbi:MBL fold metallo-hydrolase [Streptomyces sp. Ru62]|uniref:MBL fold metallo-hydrolase n=1 Tax=Streptomyces sp. Ru62 TaxID=2080745 RepID=UPI000CDDABBE|nr:MBL fold metallo-hydrolase [Streptomyces sp. Ru62]POX58644.1 MBL fold metallo-hydrolase [Streptomyces sp. Ru62]
MKRKTKTSGVAVTVAVVTACALSASPALASDDAHPLGAYDIIAPPTLEPGNLGVLSAQNEQKNPYDVINAAAARDPITVTRLRGNVNPLQGSGGNIGVLPTGDHGAFMVDAGVAVSRQKMEKTLKKLGVSHIGDLVNTHWHFDHTGGNSWAHEYGARIIATPNTLRDLSSTIRVEEWSHTFTPVPPSARPTVTVASERTFSAGDQPVQLRPYSPPGHTNGDLSAYFTKANVLFTGDTYWNGLYPFIDWETGGSIDGMIQDANQNIAMVGGNTIVVPGHGPIGKRADLVQYRHMLVSIRNRVADLKHQGLTVEQTVAAKPTQPFDAKWGKGLIGPDLFTKLVYRGV